MNLPKLRVPSAEVKAQALATPGGYVYEIDNSFGPFDDSSYVPTQAIIGGCKVDEGGQITGNFIPNENYVAPRDPMLPRGVDIIFPPK